MSPIPGRASGGAECLRGLVPDAGHLHHMPTHIDMLCGRYQAVVDWNDRATAVDEKFVEREGAMNLYTAIRTHNYHFKMYGAMFLGQARVALQAANDLIAAIPPALL